MKISTDLGEAAALLSAGQVVGFPTETVYGLAADALNPEAVARIFSVKQRPFFDPLIVHVADWSAAEPYVAEWPRGAAELAKAFWPGPLTLVVPKQPLIPDLVTSGLPYVAIRAPRHPLAQALLRHYPRPLAAPSANRFGRISPTTAPAVLEELGEGVPLVLDGGPCAVGLESTIIAFPDGVPTLLRAGGIPVEEIEKIIGKVSLDKRGVATASAPGQLPQHYAPRTPLRVIDTIDEISPAERSRVGLLAWGPIDNGGFAEVRNLSPSQSLTEAAVHFFSYLRELDASGIPSIIALRLPEEGLGRAINDRLSRAAH